MKQEPEQRGSVGASPMTAQPTSHLDQRICPGCGRRCGVHACRRCLWTADPGRIPTVREVLSGAADGAHCHGVDLGRYVRAVLAAVRAADAGEQQIVTP